MRVVAGLVPSIALLGLLVVLGLTSAAGVTATSDFSVLPGRWVRPDGGYVVTIKSVDASGTLDAAYANPLPLQAVAKRRYDIYFERAGT
jgi:hypothetical protein